jgi:hypothetical protein
VSRVGLAMAPPHSLMVSRAAGAGDTTLDRHRMLKYDAASDSTVLYRVSQAGGADHRLKLHPWTIRLLGSAFVSFFASSYFGYRWTEVQLALQIRYATTLPPMQAPAISKFPG